MRSVSRSVFDRGVGSSVLASLSEAGRNVQRPTKSEPLPSHFPSSDERFRNAHVPPHCSFVASHRQICFGASPLNSAMHSLPKTASAQIAPRIEIRFQNCRPLREWPQRQPPTDSRQWVRFRPGPGLTSGGASRLSTATPYFSSSWSRSSTYSPLVLAETPLLAHPRHTRRRTTIRPCTNTNSPGCATWLCSVFCYARRYSRGRMAASLRTPRTARKPATAAAMRKPEHRCACACASWQSTRTARGRPLAKRNQTSQGPRNRHKAETPRKRAIECRTRDSRNWHE